MADKRNHGDTGDIRLAFFLNLGFTLLEFVNRVWINSIVIVADAMTSATLPRSAYSGIWSASRCSAR